MRAVGVNLTSAPPAPAVLLLPLQVEGGVGDVLVALVFSLLHHLVLWTKTKPHRQLHHLEIFPPHQRTHTHAHTHTVVDG